MTDREIKRSYLSKRINLSVYVHVGDLLSQVDQRAFVACFIDNEDIPSEEEAVDWYLMRHPESKRKSA